MGRFALIESGHVANVVEQDDEPQIGGQWVACGDAGPGWTYDGSDFAPPPAPPAPAFVPVVSMRQARLALHGASLLTAVEAAINAMAEPAKTQARIEWDFATEVRRDWPLLVTLAGQLGLSDAEVDALFAAAAAL